jgi:hypothetical protein
MITPAQTRSASQPPFDVAERSFSLFNEAIFRQGLPCLIELEKDLSESHRSLRHYGGRLFRHASGSKEAVD